LTDSPVKPRRHSRRKARLVDLRGRELDDELAQFFIEERARRSFGVTGYLLSGGGAGAVTCWFQIGSLYAGKAPELVLKLLLVASGLFLAAVVVGFAAALAGFKAFEAAVSFSAEDFNHPDNRADRWVAITTSARIIATMFVTAGGLTAFAAYLELIWP
jgi:hypothetical protein